MNYLLKVINTYRVPDEAAALALREELDHNTCGELTAFSYTQKEIKVKGEVVEIYLVCKATLEFTKEKEPSGNVVAVYQEN